jgi:hypothetical protein
MRANITAEGASGQWARLRRGTRPQRGERAGPTRWYGATMKPSRPETAEELKARRERAFFARFVSAAYPDIDLATVQSCRPQAPDIACSTSTGERLAFELLRLCTPEVTKPVGDALKAGIGKASVSATAVLTEDQTRRELLKKLRKSYVCEAPVDLLCYADLLVTADDVALEEMRAVVDAEGLGPFRSIWFHGEDGVYLVAPRRGSK